MSTGIGNILTAFGRQPFPEGLYSETAWWPWDLNSQSSDQ